MLPATEATPLMPARGGGKEWQQKRSFHVSSRCFFSQNMTKGKLQKATIKPTFGPQKRFQSSPQMNQNALLMQEEGIHAKQKRIEQFESELLGLAAKSIQKIASKQQSNIPLACQKARNLSSF